LGGGYIPGCTEAFKNKEYYKELPSKIYKDYCHCLSDFIIDNVSVSEIKGVNFYKISKTGGAYCSEKLIKIYER